MNDYDFTGLQMALLDVLETFETEATRKDIAEKFGKEVLNQYDIKMLEDLVKRGFVICESRNVGYVRKQKFYRLS